ncbi:MAG: hypothetical protein HF982_01255 [Desulfobacteraceae bacterium]|nr:hypothetical protein [Desulfobacteraceae bacterium]MBC2718225.1 hypothetical protein [Desulfobacteraceae bacterium]
MKQRCLRPLDDPNWDYRTIEGIIKETGLGESFVTKVIESHPDLVRKSIVPSKGRKQLYALKSDFGVLKDVWNTFAWMNKVKY